MEFIFFNDCEDCWEVDSNKPIRSIPIDTFPCIFIILYHKDLLFEDLEDFLGFAFENLDPDGLPVNEFLQV